jgi:hypothetical protein
MTLLWIFLGLGLLGIGYLIYSWVMDEINKPKNDDDEMDE